MLDFRTLPCPQPVVACRAYLQENAVEQVQILVDNEPAVENVTRYLQQQGFVVQSSAQGKDFLLSASKGATSAQEATVSNRATSSEGSNTDEAVEQILVFITTETLGRGDDILGEKLMGTFLSTLPEMGSALWRVVLLNGGVKLATAAGPALESLQKLEKSGVHVLVCGACLMHYGLLEQKAVGETSNMLDIVTSLQLATKVIRP